LFSPGIRAKNTNNIKTWGAIIGVIFLIGIFAYHNTQKTKKKSQFNEELQKVDEVFSKNEIENAMKGYNKLLNEYPEFKHVLEPKIQKCEELLRNPPLDLLLERAKKYESEALSLFNQNKLNEAIEKWKEAIYQYERAKEIAELQGNRDINSIDEKIRKLNEDIKRMRFGG
jgi:tetratricopeptide (TPR) repeat protein